MNNENKTLEKEISQLTQEIEILKTNLTMTWAAVSAIGGIEYLENLHSPLYDEAKAINRQIIILRQKLQGKLYEYDELRSKYETMCQVDMSDECDDIDETKCQYEFDTAKMSDKSCIDLFGALMNVNIIYPRNIFKTEGGI